MNKIKGWLTSLIKAILIIIIFVAAIFIFFTLYIGTIYLCSTNIFCALTLFILIIVCTTYGIHDMFYTENYFEPPISETELHVSEITYTPVIYNELNIVENINENDYINIKWLFENTNF